jgi:hypothetical protein
MTLIENHSTLPVPCSLQQVERVVEDELAEQLHQRREQFVEVCAGRGIDTEAVGFVLDDFMAWCGEYRLPDTGHVLAAYLLELHRCCGADLEHLRDIVNAYQVQNGWDVLVPLAAVLDYASAPRVAQPRAALH